MVVRKPGILWWRGSARELRAIIHVASSDWIDGEKGPKKRRKWISFWIKRSGVGLRLQLGKDEA